MTDPTDPKSIDPKSEGLNCPECGMGLKRRRSRNPDACELVCGGCGHLFDVCEPGALEDIREGRKPQS